MSESSKQIFKGDDSSKEFIIKCLKNDETHGFDIDSIYFYEGKYLIFEYLKDNNLKLSPHQSDPKYYPYNWKKFYSLFQITKKLNATLYLVNYSNGFGQGGEKQPENFKEQVRLFEVIDVDIEKLEREYLNLPLGKRPKHCEYIKSKTKELTFEEYSLWLREINKKSRL